jgi:hypothetical protein
MLNEQKPGIAPLSLFVFPCYSVDNADWQGLDPKAKHQEESLEDNHVKTTPSASITISVHLVDIINKRTV